MYVHPEAKKRLIARMLAQHADDLLLSFVIDGLPASGKVKHTNKAVRSKLKAFAIHRHPFYMFQAARILDEHGNGDEAKKLYSAFLELQTQYVADAMDSAFLAEWGTDIADAMIIAQRRVQ